MVFVENMIAPRGNAVNIMWNGEGEKTGEGAEIFFLTSAGGSGMILPNEEKEGMGHGQADEESFSL